MLLAGDESELAGVLAHELAHVVARHSANQLATNLGLQVVMAIALGEDPEQLAAAAADIAGGVGMARFSREDELQADDLGLRYVTAAGYDPRGMVRMFQGLQSVEGDPSRPLGGFLATHPATAERIERLQRRIERIGGDLPEAPAGGALPRDDGFPAPVSSRPSPAPVRLAAAPGGRVSYFHCIRVLLSARLLSPAARQVSLLNR